MSGLGTAKAVMGLCVVLVATSAWAESSPFVGRWHWNHAQSTLPSGEPVPNDVTAEISRVDSAHVTWSLTVMSGQDAKGVESFDAVPNGEFYPTNSDTTAAFRLMGNALQGTFKGPRGQTDTLTCTVSADHKKMTCKGVISSGDGRTANYLDVYDRM